MFTISSLWYLLIFLQTRLCFGYRTARLGILYETSDRTRDSRNGCGSGPGLK